MHLDIAQHGGNNVCYQGFHMFVSKISASYLCVKAAGCCFRSSYSAMPSQGGDFLLSRELQGTGWGIMLCSPAVLLLTLHSVHWPDSRKPLTWLSREKKNHNGLADSRETLFFNWKTQNPPSGDSLMTTITELCRLKGIFMFLVDY